MKKTHLRRMSRDTDKRKRKKRKLGSLVETTEATSHLSVVTKSNSLDPSVVAASKTNKTGSSILRCPRTY